MSNSLWPPWTVTHSFLYLPLSPRVWSNPCPLSRWRFLTISSSAIAFSSHLQAFPASGSFLVSQLFTSSSESALHISSSLQLHRQSFQWIFRLVSFRVDWSDLLAVQGILKSLLQHHSLKASILQCSAFLWTTSPIRTWLLEKP